MASNMESSIYRGSESFFDFSCFTCQDNDRSTEADFYCEECSKFYCSKCVEYHNYLYKKHAILTKENISQWPENNVSQVEQCQVHKKEKLTGFCEDHSELICHACHVHNHQKCSHVVLTADKVKDLHKKGDFKQLSETIDTQYQQLIHKKDELEENMKSLEKSYKKTLEEINDLRKTINDALDQLEKNTKKELDTLLETTRTSIQIDIEYCTESIKNITCLKEDWMRIKEKGESLNFIKYNCLNHSIKVEAVLQEMTTQNEMKLIFRPDTAIQQNLSTLSGLGQILSSVKQLQPTQRITQNLVTRQNKPEASSQSDPKHQTTSRLNEKKSIPDPSSSRKFRPAYQTIDLTKSGQVSDPVSSSLHQLVQRYQPGAVSKSDKIIKVKSSKCYTAEIKVDRSDICYITGICETASGELLMTDLINCTVKLLDQTYKVVAYCDLPNEPWSMCSIDSSLVAVTMGDKEVHFIRVTNGQLIKDRILKLQHVCFGIAHHHGNLYITDGEALYHYTLDGRLVSIMYKDESVTSCAVSPDGDRIYATNESSQQLVTLSRDGTVISTLTIPVMWSTGNLPVSPCGLHVTDSGQVLMCGYQAGTITQVDRDGRQILAEVVTKNDYMHNPASVFYSKHTGSIIVGMLNYPDIRVFKAVLE